MDVSTISDQEWEAEAERIFGGAVCDNPVNKARLGQHIKSLFVALHGNFDEYTVTITIKRKQVQ
jgi:hypothetical protein